MSHRGALSIVDATSQDAFLSFVRAASPGLLPVARALTGEQHAAEDLLQIALTKVALRWTRIDNPEAYARQVLYHEYLAWWRRWPRQETPVAAVYEESSSDHANDVVVKLAIRSALSTLPPRQRAVLVLRYLEDRTEQETAELLGCSAKTVSSQASRALAALRARSVGLMPQREVTR
jgi:RNA polymerase sigma-70 factor (sigma-E family)